MHSVHSELGQLGKFQDDDSRVYNEVACKQMVAFIKFSMGVMENFFGWYQDFSSSYNVKLQK